MDLVVSEYNTDIHFIEFNEFISFIQFIKSTEYSCVRHDYYKLIIAAGVMNSVITLGLGVLFETELSMREYVWHVAQTLFVS